MSINMNEENTKYLFEKYPKIFADKDKSMQETCMCWGFECGDGWFAILNGMCSNIQNWVDNPEWVCKDPIWLRKAKAIATRICWNRAVMNFFSWVYLRNVPKMYSSTDPKALHYSVKWKEYQKWQNRLQWDSKYKKPPIDPYRQVVALQVKEKFGTLRFYRCGGDDYIRGVVSMAESMSRHTCETCGSTDKTVKPNPGNWIAIRCDKCRKKKN